MVFTYVLRLENCVLLAHVKKKKENFPDLLHLDKHFSAQHKRLLFEVTHFSSWSHIFMLLC